MRRSVRICCFIGGFRVWVCGGVFFWGGRVFGGQGVEDGTFDFFFLFD